MKPIQSASFALLMSCVTDSILAASVPHPLSHYVSEPIPAKIAFQVSVENLPKEGFRIFGKAPKGKDPDPFFYVYDNQGNLLYKSTPVFNAKDAVWPVQEMTARQLLNGGFIKIMDKDLYGNSDSIGTTMILNFESFRFGEERIPLTCSSQSLMRTRGDCGSVTIKPAKPKHEWPTFQVRHSGDSVPVYYGFLEKAVQEQGKKPRISADAQRATDVNDEE